MQFTTVTVRGHGRGRNLGFPTINMVVPNAIPVSFLQGVYAARAVVQNRHYSGMLYYGSAPTFGQKQIALEMYLFDTDDLYVGEDETITVEIVQYIRSVQNFDTPELLIVQMEKDDVLVRKVLHLD